jgi:hypothetical protein
VVAGADIRLSGFMVSAAISPLVRVHTPRISLRIHLF